MSRPEPRDERPEPSETRATSRKKSSPESLPPARKGGALGWIGGTALGLLIGAGGVGGAYVGGVLPNTQPETSRPVLTSTTPRGMDNQPESGTSIEDAKALLAAGDPARALKGFEAATNDSSVEVKVGRGQARWLARIRDAAQSGEKITPDDPQIKQATADLKAVVDSAASLKTDAEKQAAVRAALHLGLIQEATGDLNEARQVYTNALKQFPASAKVFQASINRLRAMPPAPGPGKTAKLTPPEVDELARMAVVALLLIQAENKAAIPEEDEPGFLFWEACNFAASQDYLKAADAIRDARVIHEKRRLQQAGRGLNPLSDPLEQIFSRTCTDLREFWVLKHHFYNNPQLGKEIQGHARAGSLPKFITSISEQRAAAQKLDEELKATAGQVQKEKERADSAIAKELDASKKLKEALDAVAAGELDKKKLLTDVVESKKTLEAQMKLVTEADARVVEALKKQKAADESLATVLKELKATKLIDEKDDGPTALAKLPDVLRKASAAAASADVQKAAQALLQVRKELDVAREETRAARDQATKAEALARQAAVEAEKKLAAAKAESDKALLTAQTETKAARAETDAAVKKAVDSAQAAAQKRIDDAALALAKAKQEAQDQRLALDQALQKATKQQADAIAAKEEEHRRQLADARAGVVVSLSAGELAVKERAAQAYNAGIELYFSGRYAQAETVLDRATRDDPYDARYWYFLGLSQFAQGKPANEAFKKGAELETRNQPNARLIRTALERIQGPARQTLSAYRQ